MIHTQLNKLLRQESLSFEEAHDAILWIMSEDATVVQASAFLALLQAKGTQVDEIAGAALAMRERSETIEAPENVVDTCSTGGNGISTFNISTCAAIIASAAGATVAKHGNRSNTRKSGSAEALQALGINIDITVPQVEACLKEIRLCFCYAMKHHPAMRFAGPIRKELGIPTIFNMLGPLSNPAQAKRQLIGVPKKEWTLLLANALKKLGALHAVVVTSEDGLCEFSTTATNHVAELRDGEIRSYAVTPEELGLPKGNLDDIRIDSPHESATLIEKILVGEEQGTARHVAVLNTAGALVVSGHAASLKEGIQQAQDALDTGKALEQLKHLVDFSFLPPSEA